MAILEKETNWDMKGMIEKVQRIRDEEKKIIKNNEAVLSIEYEKTWKNKVNELKTYYSSLFKEMAQRQSSEINEIQKNYEQIRGELPPKWSPDVLRLRVIEKNLAKQRRFAEAHIVQKRVAEAERLDHLKHSSKLAREYQMKVSNVTKRHQKEIDVLEVRLEKDLGWAEQIRNEQLNKLNARVRTVQGRLEKHWGSLHSASSCRAACMQALKSAAEAAENAQSDFMGASHIPFRPLSAENSHAGRGDSSRPTSAPVSDLKKSRGTKVSNRNFEEKSPQQTIELVSPSIRQSIYQSMALKKSSDDMVLGSREMREESAVSTAYQNPSERWVLTTDSPLHQFQQREVYGNSESETNDFLRAPAPQSFVYYDKDRVVEDLPSDRVENDGSFRGGRQSQFAAKN
eukprot:GDKJ01049418.1.p1 GENE.GDKJ01049418.1~~GDKJ01049418.1.p1  ORF type:complete len:407 (-),score=88.16 GDKJ01049418.1:188-1387(-)